MTKQKQKPIPGQGDITFELDGVVVTLKPTLEACIGISKLHNSPTMTAGRVLDMDFGTITNVVALGLGVTPDKSLQARIYRTGVLGIRDKIIEFIHVVNNGGRPVVPDDEEELENPLQPSQ